MESQVRFPVADIWSTGSWLFVPSAPATFWDKVSEDPPDDDASYVRATGGGYQWLYLGMPNFSLPANAINIIVYVHIRAKKTGLNVSNIAGGVADIYPYPELAVAAGLTQSVPSTLWNDFVFTLPQNEMGFIDWTPEAVNSIGVISIRQEAYFAGTAFTQIYIEATYDLAGGEPVDWLSGVVTDAATGSVLPDVKVSVEAQNAIGGIQQAAEIATYTDANGYYIFTYELPEAIFYPGVWRVTFEREGYYPLVVTRDITLASTSVLDVQLAPVGGKMPWWLLPVAAGVGVGVGNMFTTGKRGKG